jgi:hypothetical protein
MIQYWVGSVYAGVSSFRQFEEYCDAFSDRERELIQTVRHQNIADCPLADI